MKNKNKIFISLTILILIFSLSLSGVKSQTIYIDNATSYNQSGLSLSEQIQSIIDNASEGDTINFLGNLYRDLTLTININLNIITNIGTTIINSNYNSPLNTIFFINGSSASNTTVSGFNLINDITNGNIITINNTENIKIHNNSMSANNSAVDVDKSSNITINNNNIHNSDKGFYGKNSQKITIENNTIEYNNEGIYLENVNNTTINNDSLNNNKNGISLKNTKKIDIQNNNITKNNNGIYLNNTENTQIFYNDIINNTNSGILTESSLKNLNITKNNLSRNLYGIYLNSSDNSGLSIKSNSINKNYDGLSFGKGYVDSKSKDISSNDISQNIGKDIESKDSNYDGNLEVGANWYGANEYGFTGICPRLSTGLIQFNFVSSGNGVYIGTFTYDGKIISDLPLMHLFVAVNGDKRWVTIENGKILLDFGSDFDEKNAGSIIETYLSNQIAKLTIESKKKSINENPIFTSNSKDNGGKGNGGAGGGYKTSNTNGDGINHGGASGDIKSLADAGTSSSGDMVSAQSPQGKEINIDNFNLVKMDDTRFLIFCIILLLFGSIITGYIYKKRGKIRL